MVFIYAMVDPNRITGFEWDAGNERKSLDKHSVSQAEAEQVFFNRPLLTSPDAKHSQSEPRFHALGKTNEGRLIHITFTIRGEGGLIRVISARAMHRKERGLYEKASS